MSVPAVSWLPICSSAALDMNLLCFTLIKKLVQLILENFQRTFAGLGFVWQIWTMNKLWWVYIVVYGYKKIGPP